MEHDEAKKKMKKKRGKKMKFATTRATHSLYPQHGRKYKSLRTSCHSSSLDPGYIRLYDSNKQNKNEVRDVVGIPRGDGLLSRVLSPEGRPDFQRRSRETGAEHVSHSQRRDDSKGRGRSRTRRVRVHSRQREDQSLRDSRRFRASRSGQQSSRTDRQSRTQLNRHSTNVSPSSMMFLPVPALHKRSVQPLLRCPPVDFNRAKYFFKPTQMS